MKQLLAVFVLSFISYITSNAQVKGYVIEGEADYPLANNLKKETGAERGKLMFADSTKNLEFPIENGRFRLEGYVESPDFCFLVVGLNGMEIILDNAHYHTVSTMNTNGEAIRSQLEITSDSELFNMYKAWYGTDNEYFARIKACRNKANECPPDSTAVYENQVHRIMAERDSASLVYALNCKDKRLIPFILSQQSHLPNEMIRKYLEAMPDSVKVLPITERIRKDLKN